MHGQAFAVGAAVVGYDGTVYDEFTARCPVLGELDEWTAKHVIPAVEDMTITHDSYAELREAFWRWFVPAEAKTDYVVVSNGYPVEYTFLRDCQHDDLDKRYWQHPFPILDLTSLLLQLDKKPPKGLSGYTPHHPLDDAKVTALTAFKAFELAGRLD